MLSHEIKISEIAIIGMRTLRCKNHWPQEQKR